MKSLCSHLKGTAELREFLFSAFVFPQPDLLIRMFLNSLAQKGLFPNWNFPCLQVQGVPLCQFIQQSGPNVSSLPRQGKGVASFRSIWVLRLVSVTGECFAPVRQVTPPPLRQPTLLPSLDLCARHAAPHSLAPISALLQLASHAFCGAFSKPFEPSFSLSSYTLRSVYPTA